MVEQKLKKDALGLAGEYAVASEICRRGYYAQITLGAWKSIDIIAVNPNNGKTVLIEVKTKQDRAWPALKGVKGPNIVQVLVDFNGKNLLERPDFYIVDEGFWRRHLENIKEQLGEVKEEGNVIIPVYRDGYKGIILKPENIMEYKERWEILEKKLD